MQSQTRYLTVAQFAQERQIDVRTAYTQIAAGHIPSIKLSAPGAKRPTIRIPREALEKWEAEQLAGDKK